MDGKLVLNTDLIRIFSEPISKEDAMKSLASLLEERGFVKNTFSKAVLDREIVFPTGLPTQPYGIAIPHTDSEHVNRGAIAVGILRFPVAFQEMGDLDSLVDVSIISMLAIDDPKLVIPTLRKLAGAFQDTEFLNGLKFAESPDNVIDQYKRILPDTILS